MDERERALAESLKRTIGQPYEYGIERAAEALAAFVRAEIAAAKPMTSPPGSGPEAGPDEGWYTQSAIDGVRAQARREALEEAADFVIAAGWRGVLPEQIRALARKWAAESAPRPSGSGK